MITFEWVTEENNYIANEMLESNSTSLGNEYVSELTEIILSQNSMLIKVEDTYIGLTILNEVEEEKNVSIKLFIIHADYQGFGYGTTSYFELENRLIEQEQGFKKILLRVKSDHTRARTFWERNGYTTSEGGMAIENDMVIYEKELS